MKILSFISLLFALHLLTAPGWAQPITVDFGGGRPAATVRISDSNTWTQDGALTFYEPGSSASVTFTIEQNETPTNWIMTVTDRMSIVSESGQATVFPTFVLNGHVIPTEAIPWSAFNSTPYQVGQFLHPGKNVLQITANVAESVVEYQVDKIVFAAP